MPRLVRRLATADFSRRRGMGLAHLDLTAYRGFLDGLPIGDGGVLELEEGDHQRVVKRRLSMAAGERDAAVKWRTAPRGQLRFQLVERKKESREATPPPDGAATSGAKGRRGGSRRRSDQAAS